PDMHEDVCGNNRRQRPTEDGDEGSEAGTASSEGTNGEQQVGPLWSLRGAGLLTSGLAAGIPPGDVYTRPARHNVPPRPATGPPPGPDEEAPRGPGHAPCRKPRTNGGRKTLRCRERSAPSARD